MNTFRVVPCITEYKEFADFAKDAKLGAGDLIFTSEHFYQSDLGKLDLKCQTLFRNRYGSGEPTDQMVDAILDDLSGYTFDRIIAVGGGAILDMAKILAVAEKGEHADDLYERMGDLKQLHPLYAVPTTCGTGSEVTNISIVNRISKGIKQGIVSPAMFPEQAVLIPGLLKSLPYHSFATSSIDAMVHATESYLSPKATSLSTTFSEQALELILSYWKKAADSGEKEGWKTYAAEFLRASNYAGIAFGNAGCAAVHALSYPLGATYHVAHGESNYAMFTGVMKNYMELKSDGEIAKLNAFIADILGCNTENVYEELEKLLNVLIPKKALHEYGMKEEEIEAFTDSVIENQQRLLANNFVPLDRDRILKIYRELY